MRDVRIVTRGLPASAEDWMGSASLSVEALPALSEEDKRRARLRRLNEEQYRRHLALRELARSREHAEAESLASEVVSLLGELGSGYRLEAVEKRGDEAGWHLLVDYKSERAGARSFDLALGADVLGTDTIGSARQELIEADYLRPHLFSQLGREDALSVAS